LLEARVPKADIIVVVEIVDAENLVAAFQQLPKM